MRKDLSLRMAVSCDLGQVRPMTSLMRNFLREQGVSEDETQVCELAMAEAANNAIKYVSAEGAQKDIQIEVLCGQDQLELRVNDHTNGFDWPEQVQLPEFENESGRGLFLISSLMDRVNYFRGRGQNCLVMKRKRTVNGEAQIAAVVADVAPHRVGLKSLRGGDGSVEARRGSEGGGA